jgi:SAM-dependent methyltransferase
VAGVEGYFRVVAEERPELKLGNLRFYLDYLFRDVPLAGARVLDIGAGDGLYTLYAVAAGAERVVALEPEAAGSAAGVRDRFESAARRLGTAPVDLRAQTFQDYDPRDVRFDVVLSHSSINHLDEPACIALGHDRDARNIYRALLAKLAAMTAPGGTLVVSDASRRNLFARLPLRNPVAPTIEWEKHQAPAVWIELLTEAGFERARLSWNSFNTLRRPGRVLLGNRLAAWFLQSGFRLTMVRRAGTRAWSRPPTAAVSPREREAARAPHTT